MLQRMVPLLVFLLAIHFSVPCFSAPAEEFNLSVPVAYRLVPDGKLIEGFIVGGSIFEPQGLVVFEAPGTSSIVIEYPAIDRLEKLALDPKGLLTMKITLGDGATILAYANPLKGAPLMLLTDANSASPDAKPAPIRTFTPENFRGIDLIEVQAGDSLDFDEIEPLAKKFLEAIQRKDVEETHEAFDLIVPHFLPSEAQEEESEEGEDPEGNSVAE